MRIISFETISNAVCELCLQAAFNLPDDVFQSLKQASEKETNVIGKNILQQCLKNAEIAKNEKIPICQDTGSAVFFVEMGDNVRLDHGLLTDAINEGMKCGYDEGFLRKSIVKDPLFERINTKDNTPAFIHLQLVSGDQIKITLTPKGGGSENMSAIAMLKPADGINGIKSFVIQTIKKASGNPCPPIIVGIGIGGNFEGCALLAKKALTHPISYSHPHPQYAQLEKELLEMINQLNIGPQGLGGITTALAVHIETAPTHIASMPVAINLNCHAARHAHITL